MQPGDLIPVLPFSLLLVIIKASDTLALTSTIFFFFSLGTQLYGAMMIAKNFPVFKWVKMMTKTWDADFLKGAQLHVSFLLPHYNTKHMCTLRTLFTQWINVQVWSQEGYRCKWLHQSHGERFLSAVPKKLKPFYILIVQVGDANSQHFVVATQDYTLRSKMWFGWRCWGLRSTLRGLKVNCMCELFPFNHIL